MTKLSATTLLHALGRSGARAVIDAFCARGGSALRELLAALADPPPPPPGAEPVNGRAAYEEEEECLSRLATAHPRIFVKALRAQPELLDHFSILSAVGRVPGRATTEWLLDALAHRRGTMRWLALSALLARNERRVAAQLRALLADRDGLVAFEAIEGLRRWGTEADVPALLEQLPASPIGTREAALDAIETICARTGEPLPEGHPGPRLQTVEAEVSRREVTLAVIVASQVTPGMVLARWEGGQLTAPCAGVVSAIEQQGGAVRIILRRAPSWSQGQAADRE